MRKVIKFSNLEILRYNTRVVNKAEMKGRHVLFSYKI